MPVSSGPNTTLAVSAFSSSWMPQTESRLVLLYRYHRSIERCLFCTRFCLFFFVCVSVTASEVLKAALASDELQQAPLLVLANKIDCDGALSSDEVARSGAL